MRCGIRLHMQLEALCVAGSHPSAAHVQLKCVDWAAQLGDCIALGGSLAPRRRRLPGSGQKQLRRQLPLTAEP